MHAFAVIPLILLTLFWNNPSLCVASTPSYGQTQLLSDAEEKFQLAFKAALDAEYARANVSGLVTKLNAAAELLAEARNALRLGEIEEAAAKAEKCKTLSEEIISRASEMKSLAIAEVQKLFRQNLVISIIGSIIFTSLMLFAWRRFKQLYIKRVLRMKPEVISDDED